MQKKISDGILLRIAHQLLTWRASLVIIEVTLG
jgi:hypothetical protein